MFIRYKFNDEPMTEVEATDEIGAFIIESCRQEANSNRKARYHNYSLDAALFEGEDYADDNMPDRQLEQAQDSQRLYEAVQQLTDTQRRRLLMYADGLSYREIARREGVDHKQVVKSIEAARENIKKIL